MKLVSLKLRNFQAHKDLEVEFSDSITTIKGPTDTGKSAILRALRWVCLNNLSGDFFIRNGAKDVEVELVVDDGKAKPLHIFRSKGRASSDNLYELMGKEFRAFGANVPTDITRLLNLADINFQGQFDSPFWLGETAGEVSRQLNAVIDLSVIDTSLSAIASAVRQANEKKAFCLERYQSAERELKEVTAQKPRIKDFETLQETQEKLDELEGRCERLEELCREIAANRADDRRARTKEGTELLAAHKAWRVESRDAEDLGRIIDRIERNQTQFKRPPSLDSVEKAWNALQTATEEAENLATLVDTAREAAQRGVDTSRIREGAHKRFEMQIKGTVCPLCERRVQ